MEEALKPVYDTLGMVRLALEDLGHHDPERKRAGIRNLMVWGRAVTFSLQTSMSRYDRGRFDAWYARVQDEMRADELLVYFKNMRNEIEKEGTLAATSSGTYVPYLNTNEIARLPRPPGATSFFMGDPQGGSGWIVNLPDGGNEKYYVVTPPEWGVKTRLFLANAPTHRKGAELTDRSIESLGTLYYEYLQQLIARVQVELGETP